MPRRAALRVVVALATWLLAGPACLSPTLPLPPPEPADTIRPTGEAPSPGEEGEWQVSGECIPGARVYLFNERTGRGEFEDDMDRNGRYLIPIRARLCDAVLVWQELVSTDGGEQESAPRTFVIEERNPLGPVNDVCP